MPWSVDKLGFIKLNTEGPPNSAKSFSSLSITLLKIIRTVHSNTTYKIVDKNIFEIVADLNVESLSFGIIESFNGICLSWSNHWRLVQMTTFFTGLTLGYLVYVRNNANPPDNSF